MKRSGKFYSRDEKETLRSLGLTPTKASGAGWVEKEDGYNENVLAQLKVTDAESYRIKKFDLDQLEYHASVEKKIPIFLIKFLTSGEIYGIIRVEDASGIINPKAEKSFHRTVETFVDNSDELCGRRKKVVTATRKKDIEQFYEEEKRRKNWKR